MKKIKLKLVGLDGNAFSILGAFRRAAKEQGMSKEEISEITTEAMRGNYEHLITTIADHTEEESLDKDE